MNAPTIRVLSLGAGVQSTAVLILAARGDLPKLDAAIFSDTGWEPAAVYAHLDRLEQEIAQPAGIPIYRVTSGNIRADALDPTHRFASMPMYVRNPDGGEGRAKRQCSPEYKLKPIRQQVRRLLGATDKANGVPGPVRRGRWSEQWIGISADERDRALDADGQLRTGDLLYEKLRYPLLELDLTREHCQAINRTLGFGEAPKSACIGCPFHTNRMWRQMRDTQPAEWAEAVAFDEAMRHGSARANAQGQPLRGEMFLHRTRLPLSVAPIDRRTSHEWAARQGDLVGELAITEFEESLEDDSSLNGCSPYSCRNGDAA